MSGAAFRWLILVLTMALLGAGGPAVGADADLVGDDPSLRTGLSEDAAAASCWEIKSLHPGSADGPYWLLTPRMEAPGRFWCDMTTGGGGWVRIGVGREMWSTAYEGQGAPGALLTAAPLPTTRSQLPASTVDDLLNGQRVDGLVDRVRVRRSLDAQGTGWQEVRFAMANRDRWVWTFGAEHRVASWTIAGVSGTGGQTMLFGTGTNWNRADTRIAGNQNWGWGFAYGSSVLGVPGDTSFLWSSSTSVGAARPYAEVYVRPRILSSDVTFPPIPDAGTAQVTQVAVARSAAEVNPWAVSGLGGSTSGEGQVEVQAMEQIGNTMYVGGNFRWVQRDSAGTGRVDQPFLAAFDASTGEYRSGFRPRLNEAVKALAALPNGDLAVGGVFTQANGVPVQGLVAVDAQTGETAPGWGVRIENNLSVGTVLVRALEVEGEYLYVGGSFTHLSRPDGTGRRYARHAARVAVADGTPAAWNPDFGGSVMDLDTSDVGDRVYFSGFFETAQGNAAKNAAAVLTDSTASLAPEAWTPVWSASKSYQQTITEAHDRVWVGGSEHLFFSFDRANFTRLSGNITKRGGDFQASDAGQGRIYAGCHCNDFNYSGAYTWSNVGTSWTQSDAIGWFGAWDTATGQVIPDFGPTMRTRSGEGVWAIKVADDGTVWAGGDISSGMTRSGNRWLGGFARFTPTDSTAPSTPTGFTITSQSDDEVSLTWNAVADAARYHVLRDDRVIATTATRSITVRKNGDNRFFLRAADAAGNVSPSTGALMADGRVQTPPTSVIDVTQEGLTVTVSGSGSSDDGTITAYAWDFGDGATASTMEATHTYAEAGSYTITLTVTDDEGLTGSSSETVQVAGPDDAVTVQLVEWEDDWLWAYQQGAPPAGWNDLGGDLTGWQTGPAPLGFGFVDVATDIDVDGPTSDRPISAQFVRTFDVEDPDRVVSLAVTAVADDGAVVYVNGVEVARHNMREGEITHTSFAASSRRRTVALQDLLVVEVPTELLVAGTNVIAGQSHVLYRGTPDLSFNLMADITIAPEQP